MKLRDVDSAEIGFRVKALMWSLPGLLIGVLLGFRHSLRAGGSWLVPVIVGGLTLWAVAYFGAMLLAEGAGRLVSRLYFSSGSTTPYARQHSRAEALRVQGRHAEAERELARAAEAWPEDRQPCLMLARMLRDDMARPEDALHWFRAAVHRPEREGMGTPAVLREMAELCMYRLDRPRRALPFLAQLAGQHEHSVLAGWATAKMAEIRAEPTADDAS